MLTALALAAMLKTPSEPEPMAVAMERIRTKYGLPSICAGAVVDGRIVSVAAVGVRRLGSEERVTVDDPYPCASNTKSFTAALVAAYVQDGRLAWDTPLPRLLPRAAKTMDPAYAKVTLLDLMAHRSGLGGESWPKDTPDALFTWRGARPSPRGEYARLMLAPPPTCPPRTRFEYSNANYVLLGAALENLTGEAWEQMLSTRLLRALKLRTAGFGPVGVDGRIKGPWGHLMRDGKLTSVPPGPGADNPETLGPSATLHMSVPDMLRWCAFQADEGRRGSPLLPAAFETLHHAPFGGEYAGGLIVLPRAWAEGDALYHRGNNTMNDEVLWIAPRKRFAVVVACNADTPEVDAALDEVAGLFIGRYCPR